ncbi:MAG: nickel-dependent lactate racemase [Candidatus Odinarchaeota archaeon]
MEIEIPYGSVSQKISVKDENILKIVYPNSVRKRDENKILKEAFNNPVESPKLVEFLDNNKRFIIVVNDCQRSTPTSKILNYLEPQLEGRDFIFLVATGDHRAPTLEEIKKILGDKLYPKYHSKVTYHESKKSELHYFGQSKRGTEIYLNKLLFDYGAIIAINSLEPHYFAGYTGGRKSLVPGVAGYQTITQNHSLSLYREAQLTKLKGNPVHEDFEDIARIVLEKIRIFAINVVIDGDGDIYACSTGHILKSFYKLVEPAEEVYCAKIPSKADIVVTVARPPLDINLYQAQKAIESAKIAVKDKGVIILVAPCLEGIGPPDFYNLMKESNSPEEIFAKIKSNYKLGYHKTAKLIETAMFSNMFIVSQMNPDIFKGTFIKPFRTIGEALQEAFKITGPSAKILFLMDGGTVAPIIK